MRFSLIKPKRTGRWKSAQAGEKDYWRSSSESGEQTYQRIADIMASFGPYVDGDVVLDVGCGPGDLLQKVTSGRLVGIDPLVPFFRREFSRVYQNGVSSVGEAIPMRLGSVTKLFCCNALDHTLTPGNVLKELYCALSDDGLLLLSCTGYSSPDKLFQKFKEFTRLFRYDPHPSFFTIEDIRKLLRECGFWIISVERISAPRSAESKSTITRTLDRLGNSNSGMFAFVAKKSAKNTPTQNIQLRD